MDVPTAACLLCVPPHQEAKQLGMRAKAAARAEGAAKTALTLLCNPSAEFKAVLDGSKCTDEFEVTHI